MTEKHPYISGTGALTKAFAQFRKSLPVTINGATLKKLGLAPNNESYLLNTLRFVGVIGEDGQRTEQAVKVFTTHDDAAFGQAFEPMVKAGYAALFELQGDHAWELNKQELVTFFRSTDASTALVGERQAGTFLALAAMAGHGEAKQPRAASKPAASPNGKRATPPKRETPTEQSIPDGKLTAERVGLTVRLEVNLPATNDQDVYDKIFRSIRVNLIDGAL